MQLFFKSSEEGNYVKGFSYVKNRIKKFQTPCPIPNISWLNLKKIKNDKILNGINKKDYFYYVHSFRGDVNKYVIGTSKYCKDEFASIIKYKFAYGCQFHPELSGKPGLKFLNNFCEL